MSDSPTLSGTTVNSPGRRPSVYHEAREVGFRARVTRTPEAPANERALQRLDQILDSNQPLRTDVPRGYYINILV